MMSQKVSPGAWWVIMVTFIVVAFAAPFELACVTCRPPVEEQAASAKDASATDATAMVRDVRIIFFPFRMSPAVEPVSMGGTSVCRGRRSRSRLPMVDLDPRATFADHNHPRGLHPVNTLS